MCVQLEKQLLTWRKSVNHKKHVYVVFSDLHL